MKNSELFYEAAHKFQDERQQVKAAYKARLASLEPTKGSQFYKDGLADAEDEYNRQLERLRSNAKVTLDSALDGMMQVNAKRGTVAPTQEQIAILQALQMREHLTNGELNAAANAMNGNDLALSVLNDLAAKHGVAAAFHSDRPSAGTIDSVIDDLRHGTADFLAHDTPRAARIASKYAAEKYNNAPAELPERKAFTDKAGCFREMGYTGDVDAFCSAVDGPEASV